MNRYVWLFGLISAAALAASNEAGLPEGWRTGLRTVAVVCAVLAGYHYPAPGKGPGPSSPALLAVIIGLAGLTAGCKCGGFGLKVGSPAFGSVELNLDAGSIGNRPAPLPRHTDHTNMPPGS